MSPTHSMEQPIVAHTNGYHSSSSCSSEDGDQHRHHHHHHHHQPHHHQTVSPSASPATPPTTIQLHPPQQTYSNVLLNDFLEKPMDDLVGDLLHDNVSRIYCEWEKPCALNSKCFLFLLESLLAWIMRVRNPTLAELPLCMCIYIYNGS